jgi:hypothetical protein
MTLRTRPTSSEWDGSVDPYVRLTVRDKVGGNVIHRRETAVATEQTHPVWNEEFIFIFPSADNLHSMELDLGVLDYHQSHSLLGAAASVHSKLKGVDLADYSMGMLSIPLSVLMAGKPRTLQAHPLMEVAQVCSYPSVHVAHASWKCLEECLTQVGSFA